MIRGSGKPCVYFYRIRCYKKNHATPRGAIQGVPRPGGEAKTGEGGGLNPHGLLGRDNPLAAGL